MKLNVAAILLMLASLTLGCSMQNFGHGARELCAGLTCYENENCHSQCCSKVTNQCADAFIMSLGCKAEPRLLNLAQEEDSVGQVTPHVIDPNQCSYFGNSNICNGGTCVYSYNCESICCFNGFCEESCYD